MTFLSWDSVNKSNDNVVKLFLALKHRRIPDLKTVFLTPNVKK